MGNSVLDLIDYIFDNVKYGTQIEKKYLKHLLSKFKVDSIDEDKVYEELKQLKIEVIEEKTTKSRDHDYRDEKSIEANDLFRAFDALDFDDLDLILEDESFVEERNNMKTVVDKEYNTEYIIDMQSSGKGTIQYEISRANLVEANERLVWKEASKYIKFATSSHSIDDMYQDGMLGLLKALDKFNIEMDNRLSTYAVWWIRQSIMRGIADKSTTIRVPVHVWEDILKLIHIENEMNEDSLTDINEEIFMEMLGKSSEQIKNIKNAKKITNLTSLNQVVGEHQDSELVDFIEDHNSTTPEEINMLQAREELIYKICKSKLKDRELYVLQKRFGLNGHKQCTLVELATMEGITRERIRQIEAKALAKIKPIMQKKGMREFI